MLFDDILGQLGRLRGALQDPATPVKPVGPLLNQIGLLGVETSQQAFRDQKLGDIQWDPRYPGQEEPKFNIAGALSDFKRGAKAPKPNRFQDRPAAVDEGLRGGIWGSLSWRVDGSRVVWGSSKPYAPLVQNGGVSTIHYDQSTKDRMADWLYTSKRGPERTLRGGTVKTLKGKTPRAAYAKYIRPLLAKNTHKQRVIARPFVGITETLERDVLRTIADYYTGAQK